MIWAEISTTLYVTDSGDPRVQIVDSEGVPMSETKKEIKEKDSFQLLMKGVDAEARVTFALGEKLNGPPGTYSTVSVQTTVSLRCSQDKESIEAARLLCLEECLENNEAVIEKAFSMLVAHVNRTQ